MAPDTRDARWVAFLAICHLLLAGVGINRAGLWVDEVLSVSGATGTWQDMGRFFLSLPEQHPLYYLLLRYWLSAFGTSEVALRSLSVAFGVGCIPATFLFIRRLAGSRVALVTIAMMAFSPFWLYYSQEGRMYTLLGFLVASSSWLWLRILDGRHHGRVGVTFYVIVTTLGLYTHFFFSFVLLAHVATALIATGDQGGTRPYHQLAGPALAGLLYVPWAIVILAHVPEGQGWKDWRHVVFGLPYTFVRFTLGYGRFVADYQWKERVVALAIRNAAPLAAAAVGFGSLVVLGLRAAWQDRSPAGPRTLLLLAVPIVVSLLLTPIRILTGDRYFIVVFPLFLAAVAGGWWHLVSSRAHTAATVVISAAALTATALGLHGLYLNPDFGKEQWRDVARHIVETGGGGDVVVAHPGFTARSLEYYMRGERGAPKVLEWQSFKPGAADTLWVTVSHLRARDDAVRALAPDFRLVESRLFRQGSGIWLLKFVRHALMSSIRMQRSAAALVLCHGCRTLGVHGEVRAAA